jgi:DNA replication protein DnaC
MQNIDNDILDIANRCIEKSKEYNHEERQIPAVKMRLPRKFESYSFETFNGNKELISDLKALIEHGFDGIVLTGNTGSGKTHLAISILKEILERRKTDFAMGDFRPALVTAPELLQRLRESFGSGTMETESEIIDKYSSCELLVLDDLGSEKTSEYAVTSLYIILDRRDRELRPTIITTNLSLKEIDEKLGARIASRLSAWHNIRINMPDYRKKR